ASIYDIRLAGAASASDDQQSRAGALRRAYDRFLREPRLIVASAEMLVLCSNASSLYCGSFPDSSRGA
ncbi:MAG TPA: hypothetical protein VN633_09970, partial [Bryobacteraceae bacterium]|nr:hypothetical protein [Bryobacteraceae bacterium]